MPAVKGPEEVYKKYIERFGVDGDGDPDAVALFTFALVERDKFDWMEHYRKENGGAGPTDAQVAQWYADKPDSYFEEKYRQALTWYKAFARALLKDEIEEGERQAIARYIGNRLGFLPQLFISTVANVIFMLIVGLIAVFVFTDFSPIEWVKHHFSTG